MSVLPPHSEGVSDMRFYGFLMVNGNFVDLVVVAIITSTSADSSTCPDRRLFFSGAGQGGVTWPWPCSAGMHRAGE